MSHVRGEKHQQDRDWDEIWVWVLALPHAVKISPVALPWMHMKITVNNPFPAMLSSG